MDFIKIAVFFFFCMTVLTVVVSPTHEFRRSKRGGDIMLT